MSAPSTGLSAGAIVDARYRILRRIGSGGMATVYEAQHLGMGREVALKVLESAAAPGNLKKRFEREARAIARLDHPGCVRVFDYGRSLGRQYLAMELIEGPTLAEELDAAGRLAPALAVSFARQIVDALAHAHARGVLHRDVKPSNVMFTTRAGAKRLVLIDFGLARLPDEAPLTAAGICAGSPSYIAPERLAGGAYDARSDVYATGVVLYEMLSGRRPFEGGSAKEIAKRCLRETAPPLRSIAPDVPEALAAVVMRAIAKDPRDRHPDASALRDAIDALPPLRRERRAPAQGRSKQADETTLLEVSLKKPGLLWRLLDRLTGRRGERTVEITT